MQGAKQMNKLTYKEKLKELLVDPEELELLEIRKILDKIYKDKTVLVRDGRKTLPNYALALDVTKYCVAKCPRCDKNQPIDTIVVPQSWALFKCSVCGYWLFTLEGNF